MYRNGEVLCIISRPRGASKENVQVGPTTSFYSKQSYQFDYNYYFCVSCPKQSINISLCKSIERTNQDCCLRIALLLFLPLFLRSLHHGDLQGPSPSPTPAVSPADIGLEWLREPGWEALVNGRLGLDVSSSHARRYSAKHMGSSGSPSSHLSPQVTREKHWYKECLLACP